MLGQSCVALYINVVVCVEIEIRVSHLVEYVRGICAQIASAASNMP